MALRTSLSLLALGVLVVACGSSSRRESFGGPEGAEAPADGEFGAQAPAPPPEAEECTKMDILFVVDDSGSMAEEQKNLAANFPKFVSRIDSFRTKSGSKLDWRLAVTTTGRSLSYTAQTPFGGIPSNQKGDDGAFRMKTECGSSRRWVEKSDASATSTFACLAKVGTTGPSVEMPLETAKLALIDRVSDGTNAGFRRDDALLAIIILTDEDDCSRSDNGFTVNPDDTCETMPEVHPPSYYKAIYDGIAKGAGRWATAVIAGDKACSSSFGEAVEAKRLKQLVSLAGNNGVFSSICDGDISIALEKALETFDTACKELPPAVK